MNDIKTLPTKKLECSACGSEVQGLAYSRAENIKLIDGLPVKTGEVIICDDCGDSLSEKELNNLFK